MSQNQIGYFELDKNNLPVFRYTGDLPYHALDRAGEDSGLPEDPWFILGNYQITLFTHVSGAYELISGQRSWARLNAGEAPGSYMNHASVTVGDRQYNLCGLDSLSADAGRCERSFGCGYARYVYHLDGLNLVRTLRAAPSLTYDGGASAFVTTIEIQNESGKNLTIEYNEGLTAGFMQIRSLLTHEAETSVQLQYTSKTEGGFGEMQISCKTEDPLLMSDPEAMAAIDAFPPTLFVQAFRKETKAVCNGRTISAVTSVELENKDCIEFSFVTGYYYPYTGDTAAKMVQRIDPDPEKIEKQWLRVLPSFENEEDETLKREMIWHAYVLEAMATYSLYYKETKIPQGTGYDYGMGLHIAVRDNYQHILPAFYYNQELSKSCIRYMLKRLTPWGDVHYGEYGFGYVGNLYFTPSDLQIYFLLMMSEYLRITKDYEFLLEKVPYLPFHGNGEGRVIDHMCNAFGYLRDEVGVGPHGLVRLRNSDWNDSVYRFLNEPFSRIYPTAESHLNSALAISVFQGLIPVLKDASVKIKDLRLDQLIKGVSLYRKKQLQAFLTDLGDRTFPRRFYCAGQPYGEENMFLEPMGFTLQIEELSDEFKKNLYQEMQKRVYAGEKIGARQQEKPDFGCDSFTKGSGANDGIWWALNGPVILGVASFDQDEAMKLFKKMTLASYEEQFPEYWTSYWSGCDVSDSSLRPDTEGLPGFLAFPVFCAHPHAWLLYCYLKLKENK